jgi:hypothetical protein
VLPLWRDEVVVYLAPQRVAVTRLQRGFGQRVVASRHCDVPNGHAGDATAAFACLAELLTDSQWQDAAVRVVLADSWVRYGLVPAPAVALDADGRLSHARYVLADTFGDSLSDWTVTLTDVPPGKPYLACATPAPLRVELEDVLAAAQLKLVSLQPQLVVSFNAWRGHLPTDECWFVSLDERSLAAVHVVDGIWTRVHTARLSSEWTIELQRLRAFGRFTQASFGAGRLWVDAPLDMRSIGRAALPELEWLEPDARLANLPAFNVLQRVAA